MSNTPSDATTPAITVQRYVPAFRFDLAGVRVVDGDYVPGDVANVAGVQRVHDAAVELYHAAPGSPAIAFVTGAGSARALAALFRIAGFRAEHVDDGTAVDVIRGKVAELTSGSLDVLVNCGRLAGLRPITGLRMVMLVTPTLSPLKQQRYLGRLDPSAGELVIIDIVDNCSRHGLPAGWVEIVTIGPASEVIRDPMINHLADAPHKAALKWAGDSVERIVLLQRATGRKDGWVFRVLEATAGKTAAERWWATRGRSA